MEMKEVHMYDGPGKTFGLKDYNPKLTTPHVDRVGQEFVGTTPTPEMIEQARMRYKKLSERSAPLRKANS